MKATSAALTNYRLTDNTVMQELIAMTDSDPASLILLWSCGATRGLPAPAYVANDVRDGSRNGIGNTHGF